MIKTSRSLKTEHVMFLTLLKSIFSTFSQNELRLIEYNNSFATRRRSVEIIKKKEFENYSENVTMKEFLEFFDQFNEEFAKSLFYRRIKTWCDKTKSIIKRKQLRCLCWSSRSWFRRIHFDSTKKSSFQSIKKKDKKKIQCDDKYVLNARSINRVDATH